MSVVVGIDPGGQQTGIVALHGRRLVTWMLVRDEFPTRFDYLSNVEACAWRADLAASAEAGTVETVYAIEALNEPTPHMGVTSLRGLLDTAELIGFLRGQLRDPVMVPPGKHGSAPLAWYRENYPELVGDRESSGTGRLRHVRSALDVALAAPAQLRIAEVDG